MPKEPKITKLNRRREQEFENWYSRMAAYKQLDPNPDSPEHQYDYRGFYKESPKKAESILNEDSDVHFPDTYKLPGHPTFSNESKYATKSNPGGSWDGDNYIPYQKKTMAAAPGTSFRELIAHSTGKSNASREDLESSLAAKGYKRSDIKRIGKAYDRVSESGDEYVLHPEKGFNVMDSTGAAKTGSGKKKGNKAGSDLGDLIGLGNDVSLLAGALRNELPGYTASKQPKQEVKEETIAGPEKEEVKPPASMESDASSAVKAPVKGAGMKKNVVKMGLEMPGHTKPGSMKTFMDNGAKKGAVKNVGKYGDDSPYPSLDEDNFFDMSGVTSFDGFSDLTKKAKNDMIALGQVGAFAGPFHKAASKFYNKALLPLQLGTLGVNMGANAMNPDQDINWDEVGDDAMDIGVSTLGANAANLIRGVGPAFRGAKERAGNAIRDFYRNSANKVKYPSVNKYPLELPPGKTPLELSAGPRSPLELPQARTTATYESGFGKPGSAEFFPEGGFAKGGKMPMAGSGMKFGDDDFDWEKYSTPEDFGPQFFDSKPTPALNSTQGEITPDLSGEYGERQPGKGKNGNSMLGGNILSGLVKYGLPAAYLGAEQAQISKLRGQINPTLDTPELMVGGVKDLYKPDFSLPYQPGLEGSSLTESQNSGLAREKYSRDRKADWEMRNTLNRQGQENGILDRQNQATVQRTGIKNQEKLIHSANAFNEFAYLMGDRGQTAASLFHNLDNGISEAQTAKDARSLSFAQQVIRFPERYPDEQQWARKVVSGITGNKRNGGTLRSKFSKRHA